MLVLAAASPNPFQKFVKRAQNGRTRFEAPRTVSVKNLKENVQKIAKEELDFSKSLLKQIIPVDITIDKDAKGLRKLIPLTILITKDESTNTSSEVVSETSIKDAIILDDDAIMVD